MQVDNHRLAGRLLIDLALGTKPVPVGTEATKQLLRENGVDVERYDNVVIHVDTDDTLNLVVRSGQKIQERLDELRQVGADYGFPDDLDVIYREYFTAENGFVNEMEKRIELFENRIGDYTFAFCM